MSSFAEKSKQELYETEYNHRELEQSKRIGRDDEQCEGAKAKRL